MASETRCHARPRKTSVTDFAGNPFARSNSATVPYRFRIPAFTSSGCMAASMIAHPMVRNEGSDRATKLRNSQQRSSEGSGERMKTRLKALGNDATWLAGESRIPLSTVYDSLRRGIGKPSHAVSFADALGVSVDWLLTGRGPSSSPEVSTTNFDQLLLQAPDDLAEQLGMKMIPEVDITYSLGGGAIVGDYVESRLVPFRRDWLDRLTRSGPADVFLTRGQGDSMMPTILDDDDVLVNRADHAIRQQDRIWALGYGELGMIKRVRRLPSGLFQLNSDNPAVTPVEATEDELHVVGRVIWIGRRV
jgi:phage repressor protein C with HTH and peptisase S24 domain